MAASTRTTSVFDWETLLARLGGDEAFVRALLDVALRTNEGTAEMIRTACDQCDHATLAQVAHKTKGTAGDLAAEPVRSLALETEVAARSQDPQAFALGLQLAQAVDVLIVELRGRVRPSN
jgi:HPt (histidine-containing phosphotransfer) domain-containing protein